MQNRHKQGFNEFVSTLVAFLQFGRAVGKSLKILLFRGAENRRPVNVIITLALEMQSYLGYLASVHRSKILLGEKCYPCYFAIRYLKITWLCFKFIVKIEISV